MGRGSRHSKNAGTMGAESQTYGERTALGYGTVKERLGKVRKLALFTGGLLRARLQPPVLRLRVEDISQDAIGNFYDCRLTLQPAVVSMPSPPALGHCRLPPHFTLCSCRKVLALRLSLISSAL